MVITEIKLKQDICEESSVPYLSHFLLWADKLRDWLDLINLACWMKLKL